MNRATSLRLALIIVVAVVLQVSIISNLRVAGLHPEIIWLLPIFAGLVAGSEPGAITGFASGIALDCIQPTPFGLTALVATLLGFSIGLFAERSGMSAEGAAWWVTPALGGGLSALAISVYGLLGFIFGQDQFASVNYVILIPLVGVFAAIISIPGWVVVLWAFGEQKTRRRVTTEASGW